DDVGLFDQAPGDLLALLGAQIDDGAALVAVEQQKEIAVEIRVVGIPQPPRPVAVRRAFDLDHIGTQPGPHLPAGWGRLVVCKVNDANAFECLAHADPPGIAASVMFPEPRPGADLRADARSPRLRAAGSHSSRSKKIPAEREAI